MVVPSIRSVMEDFYSSAIVVRRLCYFGDFRASLRGFGVSVDRPWETEAQESIELRTRPFLRNVASRMKKEGITITSEALGEKGRQIVQAARKHFGHNSLMTYKQVWLRLLTPSDRDIFLDVYFQEVSDKRLVCGTSTPGTEIYGITELVNTYFMMYFNSFESGGIYQGFLGTHGAVRLGSTSAAACSAVRQLTERFIEQVAIGEIRRTGILPTADRLDRRVGFALDRVREKLEEQGARLGGPIDIWEYLQDNVVEIDLD